MSVADCCLPTSSFMTLLLFWHAVRILRLYIYLNILNSVIWKISHCVKLCLYSALSSGRKVLTLFLNDCVYAAIWWTDSNLPQYFYTSKHLPSKVIYLKYLSVRFVGDVQEEEEENPPLPPPFAPPPPPLDSCQDLRAAKVRVGKEAKKMKSLVVFLICLVLLTVHTGRNLWRIYLRRTVNL